MKKEILSLLLISLFFSCNKDEQTSKELTDKLVVQTNLTSVETRAGEETSFSVGNRIGLFVTEGDLSVPYEDNGYNKNVLATYNGGSWDISPEVELSLLPAITWGYYPYQEHVDGAAIPITVESQIDYMFGGHADNTIVNYDNNTVNIHMQHAMSLLEFNFKGNNVSERGVVTRIEIIGNEDKKNIATTALLNCQTGGISVTGYGSISIEKMDGLYGDVSSRSLIVLPMRVSKTGDVVLRFTIDGFDYTYLLPSGTNWEQGKRYTYNITFDGKNLNVGNVTIEQWKPGRVTELEII